MDKANKKAALWDVQQREYPDSVMLTDRNLLTLMRTNVPPHLETNYKIAVQKEPHWDISLFGSNSERRHAWNHYMDRELLKHRHQLAVAIASCLMSSPDGIFYACCKTADGKYRYMGHRYGLEPHEYMSGFMAQDFKVD